MIDTRKQWINAAPVLCQASAHEGSDQQCPNSARWCLTLGQLKHFHVCAAHALRLLQDGQPYFIVQTLTDCQRMAT